MKEFFELFNEGYTPADIVRNLDLTEYDVMEMAVTINTWLGEVQQEAIYLDSYKRFK